MPLPGARTTSDALDKAALAAVGIEAQVRAVSLAVSFGRGLPPLTSRARVAVRQRLAALAGGEVA